MTAPGDRVPVLTHEVTVSTVVLGAAAHRDWRPVHHDRVAAQTAGVDDVFLDTPTVAAWIERYVTDWTGPFGRLGRVRTRMTDSVYPGSTMEISGVVTATDVDETGCAWVELDVTVRQAGRTCVRCEVRVAVPRDDSDNPWARRGEDWRPAGRPTTR